MTLVTNGRLITRDSESRGYYEHGAVAYEGTKITEVGEETMLRAKYPQAEIIDAKGGVIMPAFINAHTHIYSALARGLSIAGNNPNNFYEVLDGTWWAIDRHLTLEGTRASANALYMDCIKQGVTTIFDHHASYGEIPCIPLPKAQSASACARVYAMRSATGTEKKSAGRRYRKMRILSRNVKRNKIPCWRLCSEDTPCLPFPIRPSTAW